MTCEQASVLLHALIDGELDPGNELAVEDHLASCARCSAQRQQYGELHRALAVGAPRYQAPAALRRRVEAALPAPRRITPTRRSLLQGFAMGSVMSAAMAASVAVVVFRAHDEQRSLDDALSAHLRSLRDDHLIDVQSSDQHTVKPWFNGKFDVSPPVFDLTAEGFRLIGGRLDYIGGRPVAAIVYQRRAHIINLFVAQASDATLIEPQTKSVRGFNIRHWTEQGLDLVAVSDINTEELQEFTDKFRNGWRAGRS